MPDKVLFVVGASSDIGIGAIRELREEYETVIAHFRTMNESLRVLKEEMGEKLICLQADLANEGQTKHLAEEVKKLSENKVIPTHILHLPAEPIRLRKFHKTGWDVFQRQIDISVRSAVILFSTLIPIMAKAGGGRIVVMLSMAVHAPTPKYHADYVMIKSALLALVKSLAVEYAEKRITVNGISPGWVKTKYIDNMPDYLIEQKAEESPLGRNLNVQDIIPTVRFLFSNGAECINGENILIK